MFKKLDVEAEKTAIFKALVTLGVLMVFLFGIEPLTKPFKILK